MIIRSRLQFRYIKILLMFRYIGVPVYRISLCRSEHFFLSFSTVGNSSIKSCNFWRFLQELKKEVSNFASSPLRWLKVASQSIQEVRYLSLRCKLSHFSKPEFLEIWVIKWRRYWVIGNCRHRGGNCNLLQSGISNY